MKQVTECLNEALAAAFSEAGYGTDYAAVSVSNRPDLCEYQCNGAMALAKKEHKKPIDIASAVAEKLAGQPMLEKAEACMPGFINLKLSASWLSDYLNEMAASPVISQEEFTVGGVAAYRLPKMPSLGLPMTEHPQTIVVDYGGANVAKPLHVGHLRSAVIGEAIKRMGARMGHHMIGDVHLGDWGLQMGLIIEELKDRGQTEFTMADLEEIYPAASKKAKQTVSPDSTELTEEAKAFRDRALLATRRLQNGDPQCRAIWKRIMQLSFADLRKNYENLSVEFELWKGESDAQKYIAEMIDRFVEQGIAHESQGALVVDIAEEGDAKELPPCIVRKSDGASLYATTDLATMVERERLYHPDAYIYIADQRQSLHYTSFFRVARKSGIVRPEESLRFLGFGTMNGKDGKPFKTRAGGVMRLSELIRDVSDHVYEKIRETRSEEEMPEAEARAVAAIVGLSALKYGDLSNQASKDYVFDLDRFAGFEGNTGPYILYTIVRITSILAKYFRVSDHRELADQVRNAREKGQFRVLSASSGTEKALELLLSRYGETMQTAWEELAPHRLCQYIYEVSNAFNSFYHETKILTEPDEERKRSYLALLSLCAEVLGSVILTLGFQSPERM